MIFIVKFLCIIIFIIYFAICTLLSYYFIKKRFIWNSLFSLDSIQNSFKELLICPEHFLIWLPFLDFENTACSEKKKINNDARLQIKKILEHIANILKNIKEYKNLFNRLNSNNNSINIEKIKWILEITINDYDKMYEEDANFYNNLTKSYNILNEKENEKKIQKENNELLKLENLVILENNIELCENINNILYIFSNDDYKLFNHVDSGFMKSLIYDLIENMRIYKIICLLEL